MSSSTKKWLGGTLAMFVLGVVLMGGIAAYIVETGEEAEAQAAAAQLQCEGAGGAGLDADTAHLADKVSALVSGSSDVKVSGLPDPKEQLPNAKIIVATGIQLGMPKRGQIIALATALQESSLRNLDNGDRDSLGLFQQRPSQGWGTREEILDPVYASKKFYNTLKSVKGWESMPLTVAAQKVQKSGHPEEYAKHEPLATALQNAIAPTLGASVDSPTGAVANPYGLNCTTDADGTQYGTIEAGKLPDGYQIPATTKPAARAAIQWALQQLGTPYQWGGNCTDPHGSDPTGRCDCSSLMQRAYGVAGIQITRTTYTQIHDGRAVPANAKSLQPGDLVFTEGSAGRPEHVAMAIGDGLLVHAPRPGRVVEVAKVATHGTILVVRRIV
ncbi:C40 family peptidase [Streptomyces europaeiscabiei]|uniref:C40 family peptidase n=1 Tax=Streptomyces europaeiscabiei TaxID=146819 RepID=UPI0029BB96C7|nr:C40 family peptidase [Streptomyces europaeiscabiei]MDX2762535.1 C40 family peptidase [Streptomyces europaeiscabiei]